MNEPMIWTHNENNTLTTGQTKEYTIGDTTHTYTIGDNTNPAIPTKALTRHPPPDLLILDPPYGMGKEIE